MVMLASAPRMAIIILMTVAGMYLLHAAVFSQLVALHPYLFDVRRSADDAVDPGAVRDAARAG
jgi:hypothetical protein